MFAIWRTVQEEIHIRGARSVRQACDRIFFNRADSLIKFVDVEGNLVDVINGASGAETLRQRYQVAERSRHNVEKFPILHQRTEQFLASCPGAYDVLQSISAEMRWRAATGNWRDPYKG